LHQSGRYSYLDYCKGQGIECHDLSTPMTADWKLPGDNHPNAKQNRIWAERIDRLIAAKLRVAQPGDRRNGPGGAARVASGREAGASPSARR
jgi:hypothetical protein